MSNRAPAIVPPGWESYTQEVAYGLFRGIRRRYPGDIRALFSIDPTSPIEAFAETAKEWRHLSLSKRDEYPDWDSMKRICYTCGLFDRHKPIVMLLPAESRPGDYVNIHPNTFHWWQPI